MDNVAVAHTQLNQQIFKFLQKLYKHWQEKHLIKVQTLLKITILELMNIGASRGQWIIFLKQNKKINN